MKKAREDLTFSDKLRPKTWEELIVVQINRCLEDLRIGKDEFMNSVSGLEYLTMFLHDYQKDFEKRIEEIELEKNTAIKNENPNNTGKINNIILQYVLKKFGEIIKMLNAVGIKPVPYGSLVIE
jgi:hypothetical protein